MIFINKPYVFSNCSLLKKYKIGVDNILKIKIRECRYASYKLFGGSLFDKQNDSDIIEKLNKMYEYDFVQNRWKGHYDKIKISRKVCPYCGFGEISEIDHFLPKSIYPEFSVFYFNLVPSCHICNSKKGNKKNICIHPYLENIKDIDKMLWAEFKLKNGSLIFYYHKQKNIPFIVENHVDTFDILNRYSLQALKDFDNEKLNLKKLGNNLYEYVNIVYNYDNNIYKRLMYKAILDDFDNFKDCLERIN